MMAIVPFLFFTILTIHWWKKHGGLDICSYMSCLYALSTLIAFIIVITGNTAGAQGVDDGGMLWGGWEPVLRFIPTVSFCLFIGLCLLPFSYINTKEIGYITYLNFSTTLALPILFYNLCFEKKPWWWNSLLLFTSLTPIINGIQRADRTEMIFLALMFVYCIVFFRPHFSRKIKRLLSVVIVTFAFVGTAYIAAVSIARFNDRSNGNAITSIVQYTGQGYLNYCYFCENASFEQIEAEREFPIINHFVYGIDSNNDRRVERSARQGFFISVFPTFVGDILLDLTPLGGINLGWTILFADVRYHQ